MMIGVGGASGRDDVLLRLVFRRMPGTVWAVDRSLCFTYATGRLVDTAGLRPIARLGGPADYTVGERTFQMTRPTE